MGLGVGLWVGLGVGRLEVGLGELEKLAPILSTAAHAVGVPGEGEGEGEGEG